MNDAIERLEAWADVSESRRFDINNFGIAISVTLMCGGDEVYFDERIDGKHIGLAATINLAIDEAERRWGKP